MRGVLKGGAVEEGEGAGEGGIGGIRVMVYRFLGIG